MMQSWSKLSQSIQLFPSWLNNFRRIFLRLNHPICLDPNTNNESIIFLGSKYGGWSLVDENSLEGSTIISAGLGEDASFDVEFAARYGARVMILDPTPRASNYFKGMISRLGNPKVTEYTATGYQPFDAYELTQVNVDNFVLIEKALWNETTELDFFAPKDPSHVSYSILNFQQDYKTDTEAIKVSAITIDDLIKLYSLDSRDISLLKLDIEGAEVEVVIEMLKTGFKPKQLLIEYDELHIPNRMNIDRVKLADEALRRHGYRVLKSDGLTNFLYFNENT